MKFASSSYWSICQRLSLTRLKPKSLLKPKPSYFVRRSPSDSACERFFRSISSHGSSYRSTSDRGVTEEIEIPVPWGKIAGKVYGNSGARPVLCMHGWLDNCNSFDRIIPLLPKDKFYVFIDLPGHGKSSGISFGSFYSFVTYVSVVERIRRYFSWPHLSFMSHSLGGNIGGIYAGTFPERVDKLIMIDVWGIHVVRPGTEVESLRSSIDSYFNYEDKTNRVPRSYSYADAKEKLLKANESLSNQSADILLERGTEKLPNGMYRFVRDIRHTYKNPTGLHLNSAIYFLSKIQAEMLHIIANDGLMNKFMQNEEYAKIIKNFLRKGFQACEHYSRVDVEGKHHVHLCDPENIINPVITMLNRPIRSGLQNATDISSEN